MTTAFDPYFKWLGIPKEEQPPNHYRLLGIPVFTADQEVIDNAVAQRLAHLRTHQIGQRVDFVQKLLTEVALAKVCLEDPVNKKAYDEWLRSTLQVASSSIPLVPVLPGETPFNSKEHVFSQLWFRLFCGLAGGALLGFVLLYCWKSQDDNSISLTESSTAPKAFETVVNDHSVSESTGGPKKVASDPPGTIEHTPEKVIGPNAGELLRENTRTDELDVACKSKEDAIAIGDLREAITWTERICELADVDPVEAKTEFLADELSNPNSTFPKESTTEALIETLENAVEAKNIEVVRNNCDRALLAARKAGRRDLERRATLIVLEARQ